MTGSHEQPKQLCLSNDKVEFQCPRQQMKPDLICVHLDDDLHECLLISPRQGVLHGLELADKDVDVSREPRLCLLLC